MRELAEHSYSLLENLTEDEWHAPTSSSKWCVKDIVAHLLDGSCRRLSGQRDGYHSPHLAPEKEGYESLLTFLNKLNDDWTQATYRLSPRLLIEFLRFTDERLLDFLATLDSFAPAPFPVGWAGEEHSANWFDIAREYTEKWHHQMQIREATNRMTILNQAPLLPTAMDVFLRGLPHHYADLDVPAGTRLAVRLSDQQDPGWTLVRENDAWVLYRGMDAHDASIEFSGITGWKILTKRRPPAQIKADFPDIRLEGDNRLGEHFLSAVSMMA